MWNTPDWRFEVRARLRATGVQFSPAKEAEIVDELSQHLADRENELRRSGLPAEGAQRAALDEISQEDLMRGEFKRLRRPPSPVPVPGLPISRLSDQIWQDIRIGARALLHRPAFTV